MNRTIRCPICSGCTSKKLTANTYTIRLCADCSHQFVDIELIENHVASQFSDDYFYGGGTAGYQDYLLSGELLVQHGARYAEIVKQHARFGHTGKPRRLLDVGSAAGFIMKGFENAGWTVTGVEPNRRMVEHANSAGLTSVQGTLESIDPKLEPFSAKPGFDLLCLIQVIAHLSDLTRAMRNIESLVSADGYILVETWDSASISARLLGAAWHEYSPPNVLHFFSRSSLDRFFEKAGFSLMANGRPNKKISIDHARSLIRYKYGDRLPGRIALSMSAALPKHLALPYPSEDLFWRLYRRKA